MHLKSLLSLTLAFLIQAQEKIFSQVCFPVKKVYAYFQPVSKGVVSKEEAKNSKGGGNYYIYVDSKKTGISVNNLWINGVVYSGNLKELAKPVTSNQPANDSAVLKTETGEPPVPVTKNRLFQVMFTSLQSSTPPSSPAKYSSKPFVIELQYKKRRKFFSLEEIKPLTPLAMY